MTLGNGLRRLGVLAALCMPGLAVSAGHAGEPAPEKAGAPAVLAGKRTAAGGFVYEAVYRPDSIRLLVYTTDGKPYPAEQLRGTVTLSRPKEAKAYRYALYPEATQSAPRNALYVPLRVSGKDTKSFRARFVIHRRRGSTRVRPLQLRNRQAFTQTVVPGSGRGRGSPDVRRVAEGPSSGRRQ